MFLHQILLVYQVASEEYDARVDSLSTLVETLIHRVDKLERYNAQLAG